jgi:hypothetical protein
MHELAGLLVALCLAFALVCLLIPVVGFTAVVVLWPFQASARLLRGLLQWCAAHYRRST